MNTSEIMSKVYEFAYGKDKDGYINFLETLTDDERNSFVVKKKEVEDIIDRLNSVDNNLRC